MSEGQLRKIAEYLEKLGELTSPDGVYAYRGQEDAKWDVESSAFRFVKKRKNSTDFVEYNKRMLERARMSGYGIEDGRELSDLELLAKLQHLEGTTCLIDFTINYFVALWFACQGKEDVNGKVFFLNTNDPINFSSIEMSNSRESIEKLLNPKTSERETLQTVGKLSRAKKSWLWSPPHASNQRILKQDSLFIFKKEKIGEDYLKSIKSIEILRGDKLKLKRELKSLGITRESLFKDVQGFATLHKYGESPVPKSRPPEGGGPPEGGAPLRGSTETDEELAEHFFQSGNRKLQQGLHEAALLDYDKAIEYNLEYAKAYNNRAAIECTLHNYKKAQEDCDQALEYGKALESDFEDVVVYINRAEAFLNLKEYKKAIEDYNQVIESKGNYAFAYNNRGLAKGGLGKYEEAIKDYDQAISIKPDDAFAYLNRGNAKVNLGKHEEAITDFDSAIKHDPNFALAYNNRGNAKADSGRHEEAIRDYDLAVECDPNLVLAYYNRGNAKVNLGRYEEAIKDYDLAVKHDPNLAPAYHNRGNAKVNLGRHEEAIKDYDSAIKCAPNYAFAYYNRGIAKLKNDRDKARQDFSRAKELAEAEGNQKLLQDINEELSKLNNQASSK